MHCRRRKGTGSGENRRPCANRAKQASLNKAGFHHHQFLSLRPPFRAIFMSAGLHGEKNKTTTYKKKWHRNDLMLEFIKVIYCPPSRFN